MYTECLLGDEDVWANELEYQLKRAITFGPTVGSLSKFYCCFQFPEAVFRGVDMEWLLGDEDAWSDDLQYRLKRAITFDPTVARAQIFTGVSRGCFPRVRYGMATQ